MESPEPETNASPEPEARSGPHAPLFRSIKGRMLLVFTLTFLFAVLLTALNYWTMSTVKSRLYLGERYDDMMEDILEARRYEKNFLLYGNPANVVDGEAYLSRVDALMAELGPDIAEVAGAKGADALRKALADYESGLREILVQGGRADRDKMRARGKVLMDSASEIIRNKRARIHASIVRASILPFAYLGVFVLLVVVIIKLISRGMLRPLSVLRTTTERVARGDFSPIPPDPHQADEIAGLIGAFNRMAHELEANQEDLLQARKIAALGTFTAGIAHELNNPLNNISITSEAFLESYGETLNADGSEMLHDILTQAQRASDIVKNLLDFSRTERPVFSDISPADILNSTAALARKQIELAGVRLEKQIPVGLPAIRGDLRTLQQVFMNLLINAVQATPQGGSILLAAADAPGRFVRLEVRDTGAGIEPEAVQHIFEPFFTTKEVGRGTGLGLAVAYSIVKRHGGRIDVESEPGKGSIFAVFLPKAVA